MNEKFIFCVLTSPIFHAAAQSDSDRIKRVIEEATQLKKRFAEVCTNTKNEFSRKPAEVLIQLRKTLTMLCVSKKFEHLQLFQTQRIMSASSVDEIFEILGEYWDYIDHVLLQHLVQQFGDEALKKEMNEYVAALEEFESVTTIQDNDIAVSDSEYPERHINKLDDCKFSTVALQINKDPAVCFLYQARKLKSSVEKRAFLEPYTVRYKKVCSGSLVATLVVPSVALELVVCAMDREFMETNQIISVTIDGKLLKEYSEEYVKVCVCNLA